MNNNFANTRYPSSAAINQRVKEAQFHQQIWYKKSNYALTPQGFNLGKGGTICERVNRSFQSAAIAQPEWSPGKEQPGFKTKSV